MCHGKYINARGVEVKGTRAYNEFRKKFRLPMVEVRRLVLLGQSVDEWKDKPSGPLATDAGMGATL